MERAFGDAYDDFRNKVTKEVDETVEIIMESYHIVEAQFIKKMYLRGAYDLFCRGQTLDKGRTAPIFTPFTRYWCSSLCFSISLFNRISSMLRTIFILLIRLFRILFFYCFAVPITPVFCDVPIAQLS